MELSVDNIKQAILSDKRTQSRMARRRTYYDGNQTIAAFAIPRLDGRPKSAVRTNWTRYAVQTHAGFLTSRDITYTLRDPNSDKAPLARLVETYDANDLRAADRKLLAEAICYGYAVEIHSFDGKMHRIVQTRPWEWTIVRDEYGEVATAIRTLKLCAGSTYAGQYVDKDRELFVVYGSETIRTFEAGENNALTEKSSESHRYGVPPVVVFSATEDGESFLSDAFLTQCDAYDVTRSSLQDDIKHNVDSLLALKNFNFEHLLEKDKNGMIVLEKLRGLGLLPVPKDGEANYLARVVDIEKFRYDLKVTRASIHLMACIPDLDETINGNEGTVTSISGIALKLMFQTMIQQSSEFARRFEPGLRRRIELMNRMDSPRNLAPLVGYDVKIVPNIPFNDIELVQYLSNLQGVLSTRDKIRLLPFVQDPERSLHDLEEEKKKGAGDESSIFAYHLEHGLVTINEVRNRLSLPPVPWGDERVKPLGSQSPTTKPISGFVGSATETS